MSGVVGQNITLSGANFFGGEPVQVYWDVTNTAPLTTVTAGASGAFTTTLAVPPSSPGAHLLIAVGQRSGGTASVAFLVSGAMAMPRSHTGPASARGEAAKHPATRTRLGASRPSHGGTHGAHSGQRT